MTSGNAYHAVPKYQYLTHCESIVIQRNQMMGKHGSYISVTAHDGLPLIPFSGVMVHIQVGQKSVSLFSSNLSKTVKDTKKKLSHLKENC